MEDSSVASLISSFHTYMLDAIRKRRSHRKYSTKPVENEKINEILFAAMCSPSAHHKDPWHFIVVKNKEMKDKLSMATNYAAFAKDAPVIIVITADKDIAYRLVEDASIAGAHIYLETTNQKLGTCWVQVMGMETLQGTDSETYVREILKIPSNQSVLCFMPIGYPAEDIPEHGDVRMVKEKIHEETW